MKFQIKNITGDPTSPNPDLQRGIRLYASSGTLQQTQPIDPQEVRYVSARAYVDLLATTPQYIALMDNDGTVDENASYRQKVQMTGAWFLWDLGKFATNISITNIAANAAAQFSLSGDTGSNSGPLASTISDVLPGETLNIENVMDPGRYIFLKGTNGQYLYILVN